ncbi:MAG: DUF3078 domain-containing protein [bacterium]|nr:DUF3078 domain-containing protein [Candidatus Limimorpha caballi]
MKKVFLPLIALIMTAQIASAQDDAKTASPWSHGGNVGLNFAQSHLDNWAAGGQDNINMLGTVVYGINYNKDKHKWENDLDIQLGYNYFDIDKKPIKTDDRLFIGSLYGFNVVKDKLFLSANFTFQTQMADGFDYSTPDTAKVSEFMAPAYLTLGLGVDWTPTAPDARFAFSMNVAPVTGKLTIVNNQDFADEGRYGMEGAERDPITGEITAHSKKTHWELGAKVTAKFKADLFENVVFTSKLDMFVDYINELDRNYDCPVDFDWDNLLTLKVNDWLNCNISARLVYDEDVFPWDNGEPADDILQFKEVFSLGLSYKIR